MHLRQGDLLLLTFRSVLVEVGIIALLFISVISFFGIPTARVSFATTYSVSGTLDQTLCTSNGGIWSGDVCTLNTGVDWQVAASTTLTVPVGVTIFNLGGTMEIYGIVDLAGSGLSGGSISTDNVVTIESGGLLDNHGDLSGSEPGMYYNYGTITNEADGVVYVPTDFYNYGTITNDGALTIPYSVSTLDNYGTLNNNAGGTVTNEGLFTNEADATVTNAGTITNEFTLTNDGTITDTCGGTLTNSMGSTYGGNLPVTATCTIGAGVPEFPTFSIGPILLVALLFPAVLFVATRLGRRLALRV